MMGCSPDDTECDSVKNPPHAEQIAIGFWLGRTEVTQDAWERVNPHDKPSYFECDQCPVESVGWTEAQDYCNKVGGRLPTEKEWEYAARAGSAGGSYGVLDAIAWYSGNSGGKTNPVGRKQPHTFGLYDMLGNVFEWTADSFDLAKMVVRGGWWNSTKKEVRVSYRDGNDKRKGGHGIGFRCVGEFL